jgi:hypothetical protein
MNDIPRELFDKCVAALARHWELLGCAYQQPSKDSYMEGDDVAVLVNARGVLARFKVGKTGKIRMLKPKA